MVLKEIKNRRSARSYLDKKIPEEVLHKVLEAARLAPSASNRQPWKFVIVQDKELKKKVMEASLLHNRIQSFIAEASAIIAGCATNTNHIMPNGVYSYPVDLAIALDHLSLQVAKEGLGTCWIGAFDQDQMREVLHIPGDVIVVCLMTIGYPAGAEFKSSRKPLEEIVCYDYYSKQEGSQNAR